MAISCPICSQFTVIVHKGKPVCKFLKPSHRSSNSTVRPLDLSELKTETKAKSKARSKSKSENTGEKAEHSRDVTQPEDNNKGEQAPQSDSTTSEHSHPHVKKSSDGHEGSKRKEKGKGKKKSKSTISELSVDGPSMSSSVPSGPPRRAMEKRLPRTTSTLSRALDHYLTTNKNRLATFAISRSMCDECQKNPAVYYCYKCEASFCPACNDKSHQTQLQKRHQRTLLTNAPKMRHLCLAHNEQILSLYCMECKNPVCTLCTIVGSHKGHDVIEIEQAAKAAADEFSLALDNARDVVESYKSANVQMRKVLESSEVCIDSNVVSLKQAFSVLRAALDQREQQVIREIRNAGNIDKISKSVECVDEFVNDLSNSIAAGEEAVKTISYVDMILGKETLIATINDICDNPPNTDGLDVGFRVCQIDPSIYPMLSRIGTIKSSDFPADVGTGLLGDLVVTERVQLVGDTYHHYSSITVKNGGVLTVKGWDGKTGGKLLLRVLGSVVVEKGGAIDATGLGYRGGEAVRTDDYLKEIATQNTELSKLDADKSRPIQQKLEEDMDELFSFQGESRWLGSLNPECNGSGGGGGCCGGRWGTTGGGGGGHGTRGDDAVSVTKDGNTHSGGKGGSPSGFADLHVLSFGGGGGSGHPFRVVPNQKKASDTDTSKQMVKRSMTDVGMTKSVTVSDIKTTTQGGKYEKSDEQKEKKSSGSTRIGTLSRGKGSDGELTHFIFVTEQPDEVIQSRGGNGGGAIHIACLTLCVKKGGVIRANGEAGEDGALGTLGSGGGGGAGGAVFIEALNIENDGVIECTGGSGGKRQFSDPDDKACKQYATDGGRGGDGRVRIDCRDMTGTGSVIPNEPFRKYI